MASQRDLEAQIRDLRKQLNDQIGCLEFRTESKISLLTELQEFFKRRGEVEAEYMRGLDRLAEKSERATRQRNVKYELHSTHLVWNSLLNETRKVARERGALSEFYATEMQAMLDTMLKDLHLVTKKCKEYCIETQDKFLKELKELLEGMRAYQYSSHNAQEAHNKLCRSKDKLDAVKQSAKGNTRRKEHYESKELERQQQYKENQQRMIKFRNDYLLNLQSCNAHSVQYFTKDLTDIVEQMDYDYHGGLHRVAESYRETSHACCRTLMGSADSLLEQANQLNIHGDLQLFLKENGVIFSQPSLFAFVPYGDDNEPDYRLTEPLYVAAEEALQVFEAEAKTLEAQIEDDTKTLQHMTQNVLEKYKIVPCRDPVPIATDEPAEGVSAATQPSSTQPGDGKATVSLERGSVLLAPHSIRLQMFHNNMKGKKDHVNFTLDVFHRKLLRSSQLSRVQAKHQFLKQAFAKAPPAAFATDIGLAHFLTELPRLFGGDLVAYVTATRVKIPLIVTSCCAAIETQGMGMEGLFRVPGAAQHIEDLRKDFEEGKNPFTSGGKEKYKTDVAAIASVLKAYFRELQTPLFPVDKYHDLIACARTEGEQLRCNAIAETLSSLHPVVVSVMSYLFKFLYQVSLHSVDNKMSSSNLALVFGPTLLHGPADLDAIKLHNDVPAVNILIQICIDQHDDIFLNIFRSPPPPAEPHPQTPEPRPPVVNVVKPDADSADYPNQPPPAAPEDSSHMIRSSSPQLTDHDIQNVLETLSSGKSTPLPSDDVLPGSNERNVSSPLPEPPQSPVPLVVTPPPPPARTESSEVGEPQSPVTAATTATKELATQEEDDDEVSDSDTDDEVSTMTVKATYNYTARNQKELTFSAGEILQVTEKTSDGNWWDGFHSEARGYIPVAYVEIMEVRAAFKSPLPPQRRSSQQPGQIAAADEVDGKEVPYLTQQSAPERSPSPIVPASDEDTSPHPLLDTVVPAGGVVPTAHTPPPPNTVPPVTKASTAPPESRDTPPDTTAIEKPLPPATAVERHAHSSSALPKKDTPLVAYDSSTIPKKEAPTGNVRNKTAQFLSSSQPHPPADVIVPGRPASPGHRRMKSEGSALEPRGEYTSIKQRFEMQNQAQPPPLVRPIKPRPGTELLRSKDMLEHSINFPIMPHTAGGIAQASPLQQKLLETQQTAAATQLQKPAILTKPKGSFRKGTKKPTKPAPPAPLSMVPPKPPTTANPRDPTALHEELRAKTQGRKVDNNSSV